MFELDWPKFISYSSIFIYGFTDELNDVQLDWKKWNRLCDKTGCLEGWQALQWCWFNSPSHGTGDPVSSAVSVGSNSKWEGFLMLLTCQQKLVLPASASRQQHQLRRTSQAASPLGTNGIALECHVLLGLGIIGLESWSRDGPSSWIHSQRVTWGKTMVPGQKRRRWKWGWVEALSLTNCHWKQI